MSNDNATPIRGGTEPTSAGSSPPRAPRTTRRRGVNPVKLGQQLDAERSKLFHAMGIVSAVGRTLHDSESKDAATQRSVICDGWCALQAAYEIMNDVAGVIEGDVFLGE